MPRRSSDRLSDRLIRSLDLPVSGNRVVYDADLPGFGIRLTKSGAKAFVLNYLVDARERRLTIGGFPTWSTSAAREEARRLKRQINLGIDPMNERREERASTIERRAAPSIEDLFERFGQEHLPHKSPRSASDERGMWRGWILPQLGSRKVADLTPDDVDALHRTITKTAPVRANRVIESLRKALNLAIRWGWRDDNPAAGVRRNPEKRRERYLTPDEIRRLTAALAEHPERISASAIRLMMLTGARRSEVMNATWDQFDLERAIWVKPSAHTKQRKEHRVPLSSSAVALLRRCRGQTDSAYVFPGKTPSQPIRDVKRTWSSVCRQAGLVACSPNDCDDGDRPTSRRKAATKPSVRLHDLRHTYASILVSEGLSLPVIGALLGHTQPQTTARYAHLMDHPLRRAVERAADLLEERDVIASEVD